MAAGVSLDRTGNLFGALSLAIADRTGEAVTARAGARSISGAAALSALLHFLERPSIDLLRQVLGLTSSGTVRLVDRLERDGLVVREGGVDGRVTTIVAHPRRSAGRPPGRGGPCRGARALPSRPRAVRARDTSTRLLGQVLVGMIRGPGATRWMCRLCDTEACGRERGECPVANATGAVSRNATIRALFVASRPEGEPWP